MKYFPLVLAGLWRNTRTVFTFVSIMAGFIRFGILPAMSAGLQHQPDVARLDRMFAASRHGIMMPPAYRDRTAADFLRAVGLGGGVVVAVLREALLLCVPARALDKATVLCKIAEPGCNLTFRTISYNV